MKIFLYPRNIYGNEMLYPCSGDSAWESVTGKKTFSFDLCQSLTQLGFEIIIHGKGETLSYQTFFERVNK